MASPLWCFRAGQRAWPRPTEFGPGAQRGRKHTLASARPCVTKCGEMRPVDWFNNDIGMRWHDYWSIQCDVAGCACSRKKVVRVVAGGEALMALTFPQTTIESTSELRATASIRDCVETIPDAY